MKRKKRKIGKYETKRREKDRRHRGKLKIKG
jgi:hypothetical protein